MNDCTHEERFPVARGSLWAKWDWFCIACGACPSDPTVLPRPDLALDERERNMQMADAIERYGAMTEEEREQHRVDLVANINERFKNLEDQLKPFRGKPYGYS